MLETVQEQGYFEMGYPLLWKVCKMRGAEIG